MRKSLRGRKKKRRRSLIAIAGKRIKRRCSIERGTKRSYMGRI